MSVLRCTIMQHHEDTLDSSVRRVKGDRNAIAVIPESVFDSAMAANRVIFDERSDATYPGGHVDVKLAGTRRPKGRARGDPSRAAVEGSSESTLLCEPFLILVTAPVVPKHTSSPSGPVKHGSSPPRPASVSYSAPPAQEQDHADCRGRWPPW